MQRAPVSLALAIGLVLATELARADGGEEVLTRWLAANAGLTTLRVDFVQTRKVNTLQVPIREVGVLWLDRDGDRLRNPRGRRRGRGNRGTARHKGDATDRNQRTKLRHCPPSPL